MQLKKRQKIIITSTIVTIGLISLFVNNYLVIDVTLRFKFILALAGLTYVLSYWALMPGMNRTKAVTLLILPVFFTIAVASFFYVWPINKFTKVIFPVMYGLLFYLLLLSQNVFNVATIRTIPLYRAASTAGFMLSVITALFAYSVVGAFISSPGNILPFYVGPLMVIGISYPLILQILWSTKIEENISTQILVQSFIISLVLGELALVLSFWPSLAEIRSFAVASILTSMMYVLVGITTHHLRERLGKREAWEYLLFGAFVWLIAFFITLWTS